MEAEEPALALDAVEGRVPPHGLAHVGHGAHDERVEAAPDVALPARHGRDVGLHGGVAVALRDLRVAAREEDRRRGRRARAPGCVARGGLVVRHRPSSSFVTVVREGCRLGGRADPGRGRVIRAPAGASVGAARHCLRRPTACEARPPGIVSRSQLRLACTRFRVPADVIAVSARHADGEGRRHTCPHTSPHRLATGSHSPRSRGGAGDAVAADGGRNGGRSYRRRDHRHGHAVRGVRPRGAGAALRGGPGATSPRSASSR